MAKRGYLRTAGGNSRLRIVMPGYDADDPNVPPNKVVFDSDDIGTLSIIYSGTRVINMSGTQNVSNLQIASWPELPFVPLCLFRFSDGSGFANSWASNHTSLTTSRMVVSKSDIRLWYAWVGTRTVTIRWAVTRFPVVA